MPLHPSISRTARLVTTIPSFKAEDVPYGPGYGATGSQAFPAHQVGILRGRI